MRNWDKVQPHSLLLILLPLLCNVISVYIGPTVQCWPAIHNNGIKNLATLKNYELLNGRNEGFERVLKVFHKSDGSEDCLY